MSFAALSQKASSISGPYKTKIAEEDEFWDGSPFDWIRHLPSRTRGKIGQDLARAVFEENGYVPSKRKNSFEIEGVNIISRSSMLWNLADWRFQQVRNTSFDYLFCLGLCPNGASGWLIPKEELYLNGEPQEREGWGRQHGGRSGKEDCWLSVPMSKVPTWLDAFGGDIAKTKTVLAKYLIQ